MRSQNQILMVALAIVFTVALALTVALICLSAMQKEEDGIPQRTQNDFPFPSLEGTPPATAVTVTEAITELPTLPDTGNGLLFRSRGNGSCELIGIGSCTDAFVTVPELSPAGEVVTAIADRALMGCTGITAIQIPQSVWSIGSLAFADCPNLIYISVSESNPAYCDREGILYSKDLRTLILYPPLRAGSSMFLPEEVLEICDMAFYRCTYLSSIRYGGSAEQWEEIAIGSKNYSLTAAAVVFSGTPKTEK